MIVYAIVISQNLRAILNLVRYRFWRLNENKDMINNGVI